METETKTILLLMDADARLAAAAGGAARFFGDAAGLGMEAVTELQKSIVSACEEAFEHLTGSHPHLEVTLTRYIDRIEIALAHEGAAAPAVGIDRIAGLARQVAGCPSAESLLGGIDRVQYEAKGALSITRLTKYLGHAPHMA